MSALCVIAVVRESRFAGPAYKYSYTYAGKTRTGHCYGESAAAAEAMQIAITAGRGGYAIFGPDEVLAHIPPDLRSGR